MSNKQLFVSNKEFDLSKVEPIKNRHNRPFGGLWTSTYRVDIGSEWLQSQLCVLTSDSVGFIFECDTEARVLEIMNVSDAVDVLDKYCLEVLISPPTRPDGEEIALGHYKIDFESMAQIYDAIHVAGEAVRIYEQHNGRFSPFADWLVDSTVWFNTKHLKLIGTLDYPQLLALKAM
jgi:hypothetical protein